MKQEKMILPVLASFCAATQEHEGKIDIPGVFLPHGLWKYEQASRKFFYVGRDTYGWSSFDNLIRCFKRNALESYLDSNNSWPAVKDLLEYANNSPGGFWTLAARLHLSILVGKNDYPISLGLDERYHPLLSEMGWGNLNSVELPESLRKENLWEGIDEDIYWKIKLESNVFDKLKYILDIFNPELVFVFNWQANEESAFRNLDVSWIEKEHIPHIISAYHVKGYETKIIWTVHPNNLSFKGMNIADLIDIILERI